MPRMPGRYARPWCPHCRKPAGPDCTSRALTPRQVRRRLANELRRETAALPKSSTRPEETR